MDDSRWDTRTHRLFARYYDRMSEVAERQWLGDLRQRTVADLAGEVLEVGGGTGANLPHYRRADRVVVTEPAPAMRRQLAARTSQSAAPVEVAPAAAEELPFPDGSFDAVVFGLVLCSVDDPERAVGEAVRVLRPGGRLAFIEHVRADGVRGWIQDLATPVWRRAVAGCHPNRDTVAVFRRGGLQQDWMDEVRPRPNLPLTTPFVVGHMYVPPAGDGP